MPFLVGASEQAQLLARLFLELLVLADLIGRGNWQLRNC